MPLEYAVLMRGAGRDVRLTMVDGRILYRDGQFTHLSKRDIEQAAVAELTKAQGAFDTDYVAAVEKLVGYVSTHYTKRHRPPETGPWTPASMKTRA
jgi:hypothetical protein